MLPSREILAERDTIPLFKKGCSLRDLKLIESDVQYTSVTDFDFPAQGYPITSTVNGSFVRHASGRSDIVQSDFVDATPYHAYFMRCSPEPFNLKRDLSRRLVLNTDTGKWGYAYPTETLSGIYPQDNSFRTYLGLTTDWRPDISYQIRSIARNRALLKAKQSSVHFGETLISIKKTASMINRRLSSIVSLIKFIRRRARRRGRKHNIFSDYLEFIFGWLPLKNDIFNGVSEIKRLLSRDPDVSVKGVMVDVSTSSWLVSNRNITGEVTSGCEVGLRYRVSNGNVAALDALGLANPLDIAWRAIPFSFVIDWFFSVGDFLQALGGHLGMEFQGGYETAFVRANGQVEIELPTGYGQGPWYGTSPRYSIKLSSMEREVLVMPPLPGLAITLDFDPFKASIIAALFGQRRR